MSRPSAPPPDPPAGAGGTGRDPTSGVRLPNAIVQADAAGRIVSWNAGADAMFGWAAEDAIGRPISTIIPERVREADQIGLAAATEDLERLVGTTVELMARRRHGSEFPVELSLASSGTGAHRVHTATIRDISLRKRSEDRLRASEERHRQLAIEQSALRRVAEAVAGQRGPEQVFDLVASEAARLLGGRGAAVWRFDGGGDAVVVGATDEAGFVHGGRMPLALGFALRHVAANGQPVRTSSRGMPGDRPISARLAAAGYGAALVVPVRVDGEVWGALFVGSEEPGALVGDDEQRLGRFAGLVGVALANAQGRRELAGRVAELDALRRVATAVAGESEREELFALVAQEVAQLLGVAAGVVVRFDGDVGRFDGSWLAPEVAGRISWPSHLPLSAESACALVHRTGRPSRIDDYSALEGEVATMAGQTLRSSVAAPVHLGGRLWGALVALGTDRQPVAAGAEARLAGFAELLETAIAGAEDRERLVSEAMSDVFGEPLDMAGTLERVAACARRALGADRATCVVFAPGTTQIAGVHTTEEQAAPRARIDGYVGSDVSDSPLWSALRACEDPVLCVADVRERPDLGLPPLDDVRGLQLVRMERAPAVAGGPRPVVGGLILSYRAPRTFSARERRALRNLAALAALAVAQARLHADTLSNLAAAEARAAEDPLTGLVNHRTFHERLAVEVERAIRHGRPLSLAVLDLDHFKHVNDTLGHQAGDEVLCEVARRLSGVCRPEDTLARVGGEEFAWLLPECGGIEAWEAGERAREAIASLPFAGVGRMSISVGVCDLDQAADAAELFRLADGALYWAKAHGRDVTFRYTPDVVEVLSAQEQAERLQREQALRGVRLLARVVDAKDPLTQRHSERVAALAVSLAGRMGWSAERQADLREAALVHDVGKIAVPDAVLFKPDRLTREEFEQVKPHAAIGAQMLEEVMTPEQVRWVRSHHERVDGRGYPDALRAGDIPDGARILAVADAFDVMTSLRSYSPPVGVADAVAECRRVAGAQFDPEVVAALDELWGLGELVGPPAASRREA